MKFYDSSKRCWIFISAFGLIVASLIWPIFLSVKQHKDMAAVRDYINRVQPQLLADSRFKDVRLLGYSDDYIMHPYMPVLGTVQTQQDRKALEDFIRASKPPVYIALAVGITSNQEPSSTK
jgi:hypothetical protein